MLIIPYMFNFVRNWLTNLAFYMFCTNSFLEGLDIIQTFSNKRMYRVECSVQLLLKCQISTERHFGASDLFRVIKDDSSRLFSVYIVLICQTILYAVLYNYLVCVFPGPGGLKRPFLFFLNVSPTLIIQNLNIIILIFTVQHIQKTTTQRVYNIAPWHSCHHHQRSLQKIPDKQT